jgi:hypothetical protein
MIESSVLSFPHAPGGVFDVRATLLTSCFITVGTGYGMEQDWRHGMWQGPLVVQGFVKPVAEIASFGQYGVVDHVARFETSDGTVGYGLHEHGFFGPFVKYGMNDAYGGSSLNETKTRPLSGGGRGV